MRGEYLGGLAGNTKFLELPPRARRIQSCQVNIPIGNGTTSACAENTEWCVMHIENERNYLRVRGEYWMFHRLWMRLRGTTSACAENTIRLPARLRGHRNYLRVRGEYIMQSYSRKYCMELPPRARRIQAAAWHHAGILGTTSACAENTKPRLANSNSIRNYLRVRGEYVGIELVGEYCEELPPRARRIRGQGTTHTGSNGTTSACAENTHQRSTPARPHRNYLRVRGEYR